MGVTQHIPQGEGGEEGDPLMPMLFALGLHPALRAAQGRMGVGERIFACVDDVYVICRPERVVEIYKILEEEMLAHSEIRLHLGKTQVWNWAGIPPGTNSLTRSARVVKPDAVVWRGDASLPLEQQGVKILGVPVGQPEFVRHFVSLKSVEHETLFERIPQVGDTQAGWLFLATFWLRSVHGEQEAPRGGRDDVGRQWSGVQRNVSELSAVVRKR